MDHSETPMRVRYAETDQMGVAYYANYLVWFEVGRADFSRMRGFAYADLERETGTFLVVSEAGCRYRRPLRYDQEFIVQTRLADLRGRGLTFRYEIWNADKTTLHADGMTKHIAIGRNGRPKTLPEEFRCRIAGRPS